MTRLGRIVPPAASPRRRSVGRASDPTSRERPNRRAVAPVIALVLGVLATAIAPGPARAQYISRYFQPGVPGFDEQAGVTVLSRQRPLYSEQGLDWGGFTVHPDLDQSVGYNSNVDGVPGSPGSWLETTAASLALDSNWSRNRIGAAFTLDDNRYFDTPGQNHTDWTASLGGGLTIGRDNLDLGYAHLAEHQIATDIGALRSTTAIPFTVDDTRASYNVDLGRISLMPNVENQVVQYGNATVAGQTQSQSYADEDQLTGGVTAKYMLSTNHDLLVVMQAGSSHYLRPQPGQPSNNSKDLLLLAGFDYLGPGNLRYQLLGGVETRLFQSRMFPTETVPITEANVIWTPSGVTTVSASLTRLVQDTTSGAVGGYTNLTGRLVVDHELRRDLLLQARAQVQIASYTSGGAQTNYTAGAGATWLLNRRARLTLAYDYSTQTANNDTFNSVLQTTGLALPVLQSQTGIGSGSFGQSLAMLSLHLSP